MNNVDTNHTPHNIPLTGSYLQQVNLNLNVKFVIIEMFLTTFVILEF